LFNLFEIFRDFASTEQRNSIETIQTSPFISVTFLVNQLALPHRYASLIQNLGFDSLRAGSGWIGKHENAPWNAQNFQIGHFLTKPVLQQFHESFNSTTFLVLFLCSRM
uniref:Uncharacterized protein n=1 Tax=Parascaris univalens TaxID=6257 RepID=A0A915AAX6_PARUN